MAIPTMRACSKAGKRFAYAGMSLPKRILVVGSGGREHALIKALLRSPSKPEVLCAPGNAGIAGDAACFPVKTEDVPGLVVLAKTEKVDFVIVGPEVPLSLGLVDELQKQNIPAYGPKADGARLEASKVYTKEILLKYGIPTAAAAFFSETAKAIDYIKTRALPIVIKADGLAAGKGVVVAQTQAEAEQAVREMLEGGRFGASGSRILVEDCLHGEETSILVVVSGRDYVILPSSQDHKRIGDGDTGPNTGGMGTYSPAEVVTPELLERIDREVVAPSVEAIASEGIDFIGTLFIGIMLTSKGPEVLEYNTRFGDPETQVVLPRIEDDLLELLWAAATKHLGKRSLKISKDYAICVVIAAKGYPELYPKGDAIEIPCPLPPNCDVIHAGTARNAQGQLVTAGGRVLGVTATGQSLELAAQTAYALCNAIACPSKYHRNDIGARQLRRNA